MSRLRGRVGGLLDGFTLEVECKDNHIVGRMGNQLSGADIHLALSPEQGFLRGRLGGTTGGKDLNVALEPGHRARGRLGGEEAGLDLDLQGWDRVSGRLGGQVLGCECNLHTTHQGRNLKGRLGGRVIGASVNLRLEGGFNPLLASVLAVAAYQIHSENPHRRV